LLFYDIQNEHVNKQFYIKESHPFLCTAGTAFKGNYTLLRWETAREQATQPQPLLDQTVPKQPDEVA
jgi:hypothetical protein